MANLCSSLRSCRVLSLILKYPFIPARNAVKSAARRRLPSKPVVNPFIKKRTDFIKELCVALVKYDRIQTTLHKALQLRTYGELLIMMTRRRYPPPDLHYLEDGFILTDQEVKEKLTTRVLVNRRNKKVVQKPELLSEDEYVKQLKIQTRRILLEDEVALTILYEKLAERYKDRYGGFVQITPIPHPCYRRYPRMAYVEFVDNVLPPIPKLPDVINGSRVTYPRLVLEEEANVGSG